MKSQFISCLVLLTIAQFSYSHRNTTKNFKVFRLNPDSKSKLEYLKNWKRNEPNYKVDFWNEVTSVDSFVDAMVEHKDVHTFATHMDEQNITANVLIQDVAKLVEERLERALKRQRPRLGFDRILRDDVSDRIYYDFRNYQTFDTMMDYLRALAQQYPNICRLYSLGESHEGRPIAALQIGYPIGDKNKPIVWVDGGVHAREWASPHTAMYFIHQLTSRYNVDATLTRLVNELTWVVVPVVNPDGYAFTWSSVDPEVALWRKNRSPKVCKKRGRAMSCCYGSDLNRNFDADWGKIDVSDDPCEEIYPGKASFSEPEARAIRDYILPRRHRIHAFITLHSYAQIWSYPYAFQENATPTDIDDLREVAENAARALKSVHGTIYKVGRSAEVLCKR